MKFVVAHTVYWRDRAARFTTQCIESASQGIPIQESRPLTFAPQDDKSQSVNRQSAQKRLKGFDFDCKPVFTANIGHLGLVFALNRRQTLGDQTGVNLDSLSTPSFHLPPEHLFPEVLMIGMQSIQIAPHAPLHAGKKG